MHKNSLRDDAGISTGLLRRGASIYYVGSLFFVIGIALLVMGSALVIIFQIHYGSEPGEILYTVVFIGTGIALTLLGINMMMRQAKKGYYLVGVSTFMSSLALFIFTSNYFYNWYYPLISYVFALYVIGFLILLGNTFANVVLWAIENRSGSMMTEERVPKIHTDEEIQRDIEEATRKSIEVAASELQIEVSDIENVTLGGSAPAFRGYVTRVKDDIDETKNLRQTVSPGTVDKWGSIGIEKASVQLAEIMGEQTSKDVQLRRIKETILKRWGKLINLVRAKVRT